MVSPAIKKAGWLGVVSVLVPLGILVWNEYEDWVKWKHQAQLIEKERALETQGPMRPGRSLEERVDSLEAFHRGG